MSLVRAGEQAAATYRVAYINIPLVLPASCSHPQIIPTAVHESYAGEPRTRTPGYLFLAICGDQKKKKKEKRERERGENKIKHRSTAYHRSYGW